MSSLPDQLLHILHQTNGEGMSDKALREHFSFKYDELVPHINDLLRANRLVLYTSADGALIYKAIEETIAAKLEGLGPEQMLVYQICEKVGNRGIWTRDIKMQTNIPQHTLTKTLKILEQRNLIKAVRSVTSKSKKLYMLFNTMPAKDITGGPWYTDQEFDREFVEDLARFVVQFVDSRGMASSAEIANRIRISGISKVDLSSDESDLVLQTLVYDGKLEEVRHQVALTASSLDSGGGKVYKISRPIHPPTYFTDVPCGVCPVFDKCQEGGIISPESCLYMTQWLSMQGQDPNTDLF